MQQMDVERGSPEAARGPERANAVDVRSGARNEVAAHRVDEVRTRAAFVALQDEWNALVRACDDQIFYRHEFIRVWIDNFAPAARLRVLTLRDPAGGLQAVLPLVENRTRMYGVPIRELSAAANLHSCRFDMVARDPDLAARCFLAHLQEKRDWDLILLTDVPEGGNGFRLLEQAAAGGCPTGTWASLRSPWVPLPESAEALQQRLDAKFRANLRRRRRKLEERGKVTIERVEASGELERVLEEGYLLEQSGWKGRGGTAIAQDEATRGFYSELARTASDMGALALYFLRLDERPVAFHYALEYGGRYLLLKPAYDESIRECSPGQLLMEEVLKVCIARGLPEFDFLGPDMAWKRDWTDRVRPHSWLFIFRNNALGHALREAKFRWIPAAKDMVKRWKR